MIEIVRPNQKVIDKSKFNLQTFYDSMINRDQRFQEGGWPFNTGDPEFWKFQEQLLVKGGKLLDLGIQFGRSSMFFALQGMEVTGYDLSRKNVQMMNNLAKAYNLPIKTIREDVSKIDFGKNIYDTVLLAQILVHFPNKKDAFKLFEKAIEATKPGGHIWVRASGKEDEQYTELMGRAETPFQTVFTAVDEDVIMAPCDCSGKWKIEPRLYFGQTEIMEYFLKKGLKIKHSEILPQVGARNIMFGEDWNPENFEDQEKTFGTITLLAQK